MTHLLLELRAAARRLLRQAFCPHLLRKTRPIGVHAADWRTIVEWHCDACGGFGREYE